jgi:hypothetical protein
MNIDLSAAPDVVRPSCPFLYLEKRGPLKKVAPLAWQEFVWLTKGTIDERVVEAGASLLGRAGTEAVYQAGLLLKSAPARVPDGFRLRTLDTGRYAVFLLTGPHRQLTKAHVMARARLDVQGRRVRDDFIIEKYLNKPSNTPEHELRTALYFPVAA